MTNLELLAKAEEVWANRDAWTYVQGGLGQLSTDSVIKNLYIYYRGKGNGSSCDYPEWLEKYGKNNGKAKQCTDCSNFIQYLVGSGKNASAYYYNNMKECPDMYTAPAGAILLIPGKHVGIVTKQGVRNADGTWKVQPEAMDFYAYDNTCRKATYLGALYTKAVYLNGITYISEDAVPVDIKAEIIKDHYLNDKLTASDFRITVTMSDGTVLINPSNWSASPLKLTSTVSKIKVSYKGVTTTIPVKYKAVFE